MKRKDFLFYTNNKDFNPPLKRNKNKYKHFTVSNNIAKPIKNITDRDGLAKAYTLPNGIYNYGNTLYIAGTKSLNDAWDDLKIPFHATKYSQRYKDAETYVAHPASDIKHVIGHSLGGAVALELEKNYPHLQSTTYAAPTISTPSQANNTRYRNPLDPISILDRGATNVSNTVSLNPFESHSFNNFNNKSGDTSGWIIGNTSNNSPWDPSKSAFTTPPITQEELNNNYSN